MSKGKYSPTVWSRNNNDQTDVVFDRNAKGEVPAEWNKTVAQCGVKYNEETMFGNYDSQGFDSYGYSACLADGTFVGCGSGVDRNGYTEMEYLCMSDDEFEQF